MKKLLLATIAALGLASMANATTFSVDVTAQPYSAPNTVQNPGLTTRAWVLSPSGPQGYLGSTHTFDLDNLGDSTGPISLFGLVHLDAPLDPDDLIPQPSTVTFDFGGTIGSIVIQGLTRGVLGSPETALATFTSGIIRVSNTLGIQISIADTVFGSDGVTFVDGRPGFGIVNATFSLAAVPVPASLPLALGGIGLLAFAARRRKEKLAA